MWTLVLAAALAVEPGPSGALALDSATVEQLASLDHVDEPLARSIVALRVERGGHLPSVEALRVLPGVGAEALDELRSRASTTVSLVTNATARFETAEQVLAAFAHEPRVQDVQGWAAEYARIHPREVDRWLRSSRAFALLPNVRLEYELKDGWDNSFTFYTLDGSIDDPNEESFEFLEDAGIDQDQKIKVVATWDLDELIMSSEHLRAISEAQDAAKLREQVLSEVTDTYFERRRLQVEMMLSPKADLQEQVKDHLRLMELTANVDAVTGGAFSQAVARAAGG